MGKKVETKQKNENIKKENIKKMKKPIKKIN